MFFNLEHKSIPFLLTITIYSTSNTSSNLNSASLQDGNFSAFINASLPSPPSFLKSQTTFQKWIYPLPHKNPVSKQSRHKLGSTFSPLQSPHPLLPSQVNWMNTPPSLTSKHVLLTSRTRHWITFMFLRSIHNQHTHQVQIFIKHIDHFCV